MNLARGEDRSCSDLVIFWLGDPAPPSLRFGGSPCLSTLPNTFDISVLLRVMSDCRMRSVRGVDGVDERSDRSSPLCDKLSIRQTRHRIMVKSVGETHMYSCHIHVYRYYKSAQCGHLALRASQALGKSGTRNSSGSTLNLVPSSLALVFLEKPSGIGPFLRS